MKEVFERLDKYNDNFIRRRDFIRALRTDMRVIDFIDTEAVKKANSNSVLTLDQVFFEVENDEKYQQKLLGKDDDKVNSKEYITWDEFLQYFNDYQEIDVRNEKASALEKLKKPSKKDSG